MALKASPIWVCPSTPCFDLGSSDLWSRKSGSAFNLRFDLEMPRKWECCCLAILAQRAITSVEDEKPNVSEHLSANDLSSCSKDGSKVRVAYQGFPGAYSEAAALKAYPKCETVPRDQFEEAFKVHIVVITYFIVDKAILPIENSVGGSIHRNYDLLLRHRLNIVGKVQLQVNHCLLGLSGVRKEEIKNVLSHPQATLIMAIALGYVSIR
ncbi:arogenate dehydratase/prephenate dehydratase 1 [Quercus suber]|uniref:Arogenate dehydratase/prephenate dehydratase 1 n=1 Tax=Quercus suber TaxID=58331 RepID=A0AAW0KBJ4_QUESU